MNDMTMQELIAAAKEKSVTVKTIKEFEARVKKRQKQFDKESRRQAVNNDFMARSYNL